MSAGWAPRFPLSVCLPPLAQHYNMVHCLCSICAHKRGAFGGTHVPTHPMVVSTHTHDTQEGDIVILDKADGEWCYGRNQRTGKYGMFPGAYVQEVKK